MSIEPKSDSAANPAANPADPEMESRIDPGMQPFLKWAGGKRQLLPAIRSFLPRDGWNRFFEPFVGAGAVLFDLRPPRAVINDSNGELINLYRVIRDQAEEFMTLALAIPRGKEEYYRQRQRDRDPQYLLRSSPVERAARIAYLNKTCFNGLFRVNSRGHFNVPYGDYANPKIVDERNIRAVSSYLKSASIEILHGDFEAAVETAGSGDFVYFDPPYFPLSETSSFTGYSKDAFGVEEQVRLKLLCDRLHERGCQILLSNSSTEFIRDLFGEGGRYDLSEVQANRSINSVGTGRNKIPELLIMNRYARIGDTRASTSAQSDIPRCSSQYPS